MLTGFNQCRSISKRGLDIRFWYDQAVMENLHPELRETSPQLRTRVTANESFHIEDC